MDKSTGPLTFAASFPRDARFVPTAGELAARLALTTGCDEGVSQEIRGAVAAAFEAALAGDVDAPVELALRTADGAFGADLTCGACSHLHLTRPCTV